MQYLLTSILLICAFATAACGNTHPDAASVCPDSLAIQLKLTGAPYPAFNPGQMSDRACFGLYGQVHTVYTQINGNRNCTNSTIFDPDGRLFFDIEAPLPLTGSFACRPHLLHIDWKTDSTFTNTHDDATYVVRLSDGCREKAMEGDDWVEERHTFDAVGRLAKHEITPYDMDWDNMTYNYIYADSAAPAPMAMELLNGADVVAARYCYEYTEYDSLGNWTEATVYQTIPGNYTYTVRRAISYYEPFATFNIDNLHLPCNSGGEVFADFIKKFRSDKAFRESRYRGNEYEGRVEAMDRFMNQENALTGFLDLNKGSEVYSYWAVKNADTVEYYSFGPWCQDGPRHFECQRIDGKWYATLLLGDY